MNVFFSFAENNQLQEHNLKLNKPRAKKSVSLNSFPLRNIPVSKSLPADTFNSKTVVELEEAGCFTLMLFFHISQCNVLIVALPGHTQLF